MVTPTSRQGQFMLWSLLGSVSSISGQETNFWSSRWRLPSETPCYQATLSIESNRPKNSQSNLHGMRLHLVKRYAVMIVSKSIEQADARCSTSSRRTRHLCGQSARCSAAEAGNQMDS